MPFCWAVVESQLGQDAEREASRGLLGLHRRAVVAHAPPGPPWALLVLDHFHIAASANRAAAPRRRAALSSVISRAPSPTPATVGVGRAAAAGNRLPSTEAGAGCGRLGEDDGEAFDDRDVIKPIARTHYEMGPDTQRRIGAPERCNQTEESIMTRLNRVFVASIPLFAFLTAVPAQANGNLFQRCADDQLYTSVQAQGRNAWAKKCGYLSQQYHDMANSVEMYLVFTTGKFGGNPNIPVDATKPCINGLTPLGLCVKGCYTPNQSLDFSGKEMSIESAYHDPSISTVAALTEEATLSNLQFSEQPIQAFVAGDTTEAIFVLHGDNGATLEVTSEHPMVLSDGSMLVARELVVGDELLDRDGEPVELVTIDLRRYSGTVWNIQPESKSKQENILVAQGFLTGSVRFQNEWADELWRLMRRETIELPRELRSR